MEKPSKQLYKSSKERNPLRTARRSIWYVLRFVLVVTAILGLCYAVFTEAMYISNIYIVVTEGMALRAKTVLMSGSASDLNQYYTEEYLNSEPMLYEGIYNDFTVDSYDYRYNIESMYVLPWAKTGTVTYVERIPSIHATANVESEAGEVPEWTAIRCLITLVKVDGRWLIDSIEILEENPVEEVKPTPDYGSLPGSAMPTSKPTSKPTTEPSFAPSAQPTGDS